MRYTWYENYPNNRIIVNGVDLSTTYRMVLADGYSLGVPEAKTYTVDILGGDGVIDLTESLVGDTLYNNRTQEFTFYIIDQQNQEDFEDVKTAVSNFLHGKAYDYVLTFDPEYIYHGRFHVSAYEHQAFPSGILGAIKITIDADPYKSKGTMSYSLNPVGGREYEFVSGRKKVHPVLTCSEPCKVNFDGTSLTVPSGTYRLNPVIFSEGANIIYLNSHQLYSITWDDIGEDGDHALLWTQPEWVSRTSEYASSSDGNAIPSSWSSTYPTSGDYIWTRTIDTYSNGVKTYSYSVLCDMDSDGYGYIADDDGNYIADDSDIYESMVDSITTWYTATDSGTSIPDDDSWLYYDLIGAWLDAYDEQYTYVYLFEETSSSYIVYLWLRVETLYNDDTKTVVYQVSQESTYDDSYTEVVTYAASLSGTDIPEGTWSTAYPVTEDYPYIWTKTVKTYSSTGSVTTSYDVLYLASEDYVSVETIDTTYYSVVALDDYDIYLSDDEGEYIEDESGNDIETYIPSSSSSSLNIDLYDIYSDDIWETSRPEIDDIYNYVIITRTETTYSNDVVIVDYSLYTYMDYELESEEIYFCDSTSGTIIPSESASWYENSDSVGSGTYTWTKRIYIYDGDISVVVYSSVCNDSVYWGTITAESVNTRYQYSSSPDYLSMMATGRFEWIKTITEYTDGSSKTEYVCTYNVESLAASSYRWDELHLLLNGKLAYKRTWSDISSKTWQQLSGYGDYSITWDSLDYKDADIPDAYVTLEYDWKDL